MPDIQPLTSERASVDQQPPNPAGPARKSRTGLKIAAVVVAIVIVGAIIKRDAVMRYVEESMPLSMLEGRVRSNPSDVVAAEIMTRRLLKAGKGQEALKVLSDATSKGDVPGDIWLFRARAAHKAGDDIDASRSAQKSLASTTKPANAHWLIGMAAQSAGSEGLAQTEFKKVTELDPQNGQAWVQLGKYSLKYTLRGAAVDQFQHALTASPRDASASSGLADALFAMSKFDEAEKHARNAIEWNAELPDGHLSLARILAAKGNPADAATVEVEFKETMRLSPNAVVAHRFLATYYLQKGEPQKALETLEEAIKLRPFQKECYPLLVRAYRLVGKPAEAEKMQAKYQELESADAKLRPMEQKVWSAPADVPLRIELINAYLAHGRKDLARHQFGQLRRIAPDSPDVKALLARVPDLASQQAGTKYVVPGTESGGGQE